MYGAYARGAPAIVELGCGRGGDISKWRDARVRRVIALDLSSAQLDEARRREGQGGGRGGGGKGGGGGTQIEWRHASMLQPDLAASLRPRLPDDGAAAVVSQFAVHYAFESGASASALLAQVAALLRPGGVFFGAAPDGDAILRAIATDGAPLQRDGLLLRLEGAGDDAAAAGASEFGRLLLFSLQDTVTAGSEHDDCTEFLLHRAALVRLAAAHGLVPIELESMAASAAEPASAATALDAAQRYVAALYFTFAFRLERGAVGSTAAAAAPPRRRRRSHPFCASHFLALPPFRAPPRRRAPRRSSPRSGAPRRFGPSAQAAHASAAKSAAATARSPRRLRAPPPAAGAERRRRATVGAGALALPPDRGRRNHLRRRLDGNRRRARARGRLRLRIRPTQRRKRRREPLQHARFGDGVAERGGERERLAERHVRRFSGRGAAAARRAA